MGAGEAKVDLLALRRRVRRRGLLGGRQVQDDLKRQAVHLQPAKTKVSLHVAIAPQIQTTSQAPHCCLFLPLVSLAPT